MEIFVKRLFYTSFFGLCTISLYGCWAMGAASKADDILGPIDSDEVTIDLTQVKENIDNKASAPKIIEDFLIEDVMVSFSTKKITFDDKDEISSTDRGNDKVAERMVETRLPLPLPPIVLENRQLISRK